MLHVFLVALCSFTIVAAVGWTYTQDRPINYRYEHPPIPAPLNLGDPTPDYLWWQQIDALMLIYRSMNGPHWVQDWGWRNLSFTPFSYYANICKYALGDPVQIISGVLCQNGAITQINLANNNLTGVLPSYKDFFSYFDNQNIQYVFNGNPALTGPIPTGFTYNVSQMSLFHAMQCNLTGTIPDDIFTQNMQNLALYGNRLIIDPLSPHVGNATSLQWLYIGDNLRTGGVIPKEICRCPLIGLDLTGPSGFTGLPECFGHSMRDSLQTLNLYDNKFSGDIPQNWCNLTQLQHLYLQLNADLTGTLPDCIGNFKGLVSLAVLNTLMTGPFPSWIFGLHYLENLILGGSNFYGPIPDWFGNLTSLVTISLGGTQTFDRGNTWTGPLPMSLFKRENLTLIEFQNTKLEGRFPNVSNLTLLCQLYINQNLFITGEFPVELLTSVWLTNITLSLQQVNRSITIAQTGFSGLLPSLTRNQTDKILWLNRKANAFFLQKNNWYGYIHESMAWWMPIKSFPQLLLNNPNIYYPVLPEFLPMTYNYIGHPCDLAKISGSPWDIRGGQNVSLYAALGYSTGYRLAFYSLANTTHEVFSLPEEEAWERRLGDVEVVLKWNFPTSTPIMGTYATILTPNLTETGLDAVWFTLYDTHFVTHGVQTPVRVTDSVLQVALYNPKPHIYAVEPNYGRLQGCISMTLFGSGFLHAPMPQLTFYSAEQQQVVAYIEDQVVIYNDTMVLFVLPPVNASNLTQSYADDLGTLRVFYYPDGYVHPDHVSQGWVPYNFVTQCPGELIECANGHSDVDNCPIQPLCGCQSRGVCVENVTDVKNYTCECDDGFTGPSCNNCTFNRYGETCQACDCEHGTCNWGIDADGSCNCERHYMGSRCSISKVVLAVVIPLSVLALSGFAVFIKRRYCRGPKDEESLNSAELRRPLTRD